MAQAGVPATQTSQTSATDSAHVGTLRLSVKKKKLTWTEDVIDNEHAGKKKSNSAFGRVEECAHGALTTNVERAMACALWGGL